MSTDQVCVKKVGNARCGKPAVSIDKHDRFLCEKHYKEWMAGQSKRQGWFDHSTLTVKFGGALSLPERCFVAKAVKVPTYKYSVYERESLGNGWYGSKELVEYTQDNQYLILLDGKIIGWMNPYYNGPKSELHALDWEHTPQQVKNFAEQFNKQVTP